MSTYYPPPGFHFRVEFLFGGEPEPLDTNFQSVSGLDVQINTENVSEGGENQFVHVLPTRIQYSNLILKRGLVKGTRLFKWCKQTFDKFQSGPVGIPTANINVSLLNQQHEPLMTWKIQNAWPVKWSVSEFNAEQSAIVVETMEFKYDYFNIE